MIYKGTLSEAKAFQAKTPGSHLVFDGGVGIVYSEAEEKQMRDTVQRTIPTYEFRDRFTEEEIKTLLVKAETDIHIKLLMFKLQTVFDISLDTDTVINGVSYLVTVGAVDKARVLEILR